MSEKSKKGKAGVRVNHGARLSTHNQNGEEILDPTPMQLPLGYKRQLTLAEMVQGIVKSDRLRQEAEERGYESEKDANDFDVGEEGDYVPYSPYELRHLEGETAPPRQPGETKFTEERPSVKQEAGYDRRSGNRNPDEDSERIDQRVESAIRSAFLRFTKAEDGQREGAFEADYRSDEARPRYRSRDPRDRSDTQR